MEEGRVDWDWVEREWISDCGGWPWSSGGTLCWDMGFAGRRDGKEESAGRSRDKTRTQKTRDPPLIFQHPPRRPNSGVHRPPMSHNGPYYKNISILLSVTSQSTTKSSKSMSMTTFTSVHLNPGMKGG